MTKLFSDINTSNNNITDYENDNVCDHDNDSFSSEVINADVKIINRVPSDDEKYDMIMKYKELYGNFAVPREFQINSNDEKWGEFKELHGFKLGIFINNMKSRGNSYSNLKERLTLVGFSHKRKTSITADVTIDMLLKYKYIYNEPFIYVPYNFVVPCTNEWPTKMHGIALGRITSNLVNGRMVLSEKEKDQMERIGVRFKI